MEEQRRVCPQSWCGAGAWLVRSDAWLEGVWQLSHASEGGTWTVAAADPVCPRCGTTLLATLELEDGLDGSHLVPHYALLEELPMR